VGASVAARGGLQRILSSAGLTLPPDAAVSGGASAVSAGESARLTAAGVASFDAPLGGGGGRGGVPGGAASTSLPGAASSETAPESAGALQGQDEHNFGPAGAGGATVAGDDNAANGGAGGAGSSRGGSNPRSGGGGGGGGGPAFDRSGASAAAAGVAVTGVVATGLTSVATVVNSGAFTNAVDPVYGAGIYGAAGGGIVPPLVAQPSVFYGGAYGGYGYVPGRSPVRVYLFSECAHPSLAATWSGCYCALCYIDVSPLQLGSGGQRLLNDYALAANAVAANDLKAAALRAQHAAAQQAAEQTVNARLTGLVDSVVLDVQTTAALLYSMVRRAHTQFAEATYTLHNPTYPAAAAALGATG
jgi:hypothetical protein